MDSKKSPLLLLIFTVASFGGCEKPRLPGSSTPTPRPGPTPEVVVVPWAAATPATPKPNLAPDGVVYLVKRISVTTDTSVIGIPEGTRVDILRRSGGRIAGQVGGMVIEMAAEDTSNDLDLVSAILKRQAEAQAAHASKIDPLEAAGIHLPEAKPPTVAERRAARVETLKKIQILETSIENGKKQLAELNTLKVEAIRKSLTKAKSRDKKTGKEKIEEIDPSLDTSINDLKETIEKAQKEVTYLKASLGL